MHSDAPTTRTSPQASRRWWAGFVLCEHVASQATRTHHPRGIDAVHNFACCTPCSRAGWHHADLDISVDDGGRVIGRLPAAEMG